MRRIFLIGYMGAGKTTVGRLLAKRANVSFIDLDHYIEGRFHQQVPAIFAQHGEEGFRDIERRMLHEVAEFEDVLISAGGGTPCFFDNMDYMNAHGTTVYLKVSVDELANRLSVGRNTRPVLGGRKGEELKAFIRENLEKRRPYYERAQIIFDAERMLTRADALHLAETLLNRVERDERGKTRETL